MPVYEFYCCDCHTIFNFLSRTANTERRPACPKCKKPELERKVSNFAISRGRKDEPGGDGLPGLDESKLEKALMGMAGEFEGMDENNPRQMAHVMKRLAEATGMDLGSGIGEAIRRLEAGEDPEKIEEELGDALGDDSMDSLFTTDGMKGLKRRYAPPSHDDTLYTFDQTDS